LAGQEKSYTLELTFKESSTDDDSHIALVALDDYYAFISDEGVLRKYIFDWNVRDYEGAVEVNREILASLSDPSAPEFWWLNNGVTVICSKASVTGKTFSLDDVQIVNGLQSSATIHDYLHDAETNDPARTRGLLVRIIVTYRPRPTPRPASRPAPPTRTAAAAAVGTYTSSGWGKAPLGRGCQESDAVMTRRPARAHPALLPDRCERRSVDHRAGRPRRVHGGLTAEDRDSAVPERDHVDQRLEPRRCVEHGEWLDSARKPDRFENPGLGA
jgi:hypothetical protein